MIRTDRLVSLFKELCLINAPALAEANVVARVRSLLTEAGLEVWEDEAGSRLGGNANNLIARLPATQVGLPRIFLSAHFDTVEPTAGLTIVEEGDVLRSDGTTILGGDDKGGMVPAIEAVLSVMEDGEPHGEVLLLLTVAEEIGLLGASVLDIRSLNVDFGYVLDTGPPVGSYVTRAATHDKLEVTIIGKPAHAGKDPEKGVSAIQVMADAIQGMTLGRIGPETTANIGIVEGGTAVNVVCSRVKLRGEARSTDTEALDRQIDHMKSRFAEAAARWGAEVEIVHDRHYGSYVVDESSQVVKVAQEASRRLGLEPTLRTTLGGSDANIFNARGVPTIVVATGMEKIHTHEEYIRVSDLVKTAELARELIRVAAS